MEENAADNLEVLVNALGGMLDVPTLEEYKDALGSIRGEKGLDHAALAQGLSKLKGALDKKSSGDLAASILDRVNCLTELIKTRASAKAETSALKDALEVADANAEASERAAAAAKRRSVRPTLARARSPSARKKPPKRRARAPRRRSKRVH